MDRNVICPIMTATDDIHPHPCVNGNCGFWSKDAKMCGVASIGLLKKLLLFDNLPFKEKIGMLLQ